MKTECIIPYRHTGECDKCLQIGRCDFPEAHKGRIKIAKKNIKGRKADLTAARKELERLINERF